MEQHLLFSAWAGKGGGEGSGLRQKKSPWDCSCRSRDGLWLSQDGAGLCLLPLWYSSCVAVFAQEPVLHGLGFTPLKGFSFLSLLAEATRQCCWHQRKA